MRRLGESSVSGDDGAVEGRCIFRCLLLLLRLAGGLSLDDDVLMTVDALGIATCVRTWPCCSTDTRLTS